MTDWNLVAAIGSTGAQGATGNPNGPIAIGYTFSTTTTDSNPGNGVVRLDNATQNTAATIRANVQDNLGVDWTAVLDTLDASTSIVEGQIRLVKANDLTKWLLFNVTARAAPSGYRNLTVTNIGSSSASPFANNDSIVLLFSRTGDKGVSGLKNAIINGAFNIWQRGTSFAAVAAGIYTADRWKEDYVTSAAVTISQDSSAPPALATSGRYFNYAMKFACTTADASVTATKKWAFFQMVEGFNWQAFAQQPLVLTFYVKSSKTGIFSVGFTNSGVDRTYVAEYTINNANTWEKKTITVSASPSAGTWNYTNGIGLYVLFPLMAGSNFTTSSLNTWNSNGLYVSSNQVNFLDSNTATFFITGVQLEIGPAASPYEYKTWEQELQECQRYYWKTFPYGTAPAQSATNVGALGFWATTAVAQEPFCHVRFPTSMRQAPTLATYNPSANNSSWRCTAGAGSDIAAGTGGTSKSADTFFMVGTSNTPATQGAECYIHATADAEL